MADGGWASGQVIAGKYRLVDKLGEGGMGAIWRADHIALKSQVALKILNDKLLSTEEAALRFHREAQAAAQIRSPHVVQILDHGVEDGVPYMAMELLEGETLASRLHRTRMLPLGQVARIVTHVGRAITRAHEAGIVHRDLKPENIFLVHNEDEEIAKVLDFGIAKVSHALAEKVGKVSTQGGALLGTPNYMSPEQVRGHALDHRSDLWSLGVIAYECATGSLPFDAGTMGDLLLKICTEALTLPSTVAPLPRSFDDWFVRACARVPENRFQSAREMTDALRAIAGERVEEVGARALPSEAPSAARNAETLQSAGAAESGAATPTFVAAETVAIDARKKTRTARSLAVAGAVFGCALGIGLAHKLVSGAHGAALAETAAHAAPSVAPSSDVPAKVEPAEQAPPAIADTPAPALGTSAPAAPPKRIVPVRSTAGSATTHASQAPKADAPPPPPPASAEPPKKKEELGF